MDGVAGPDGACERVDRERIERVLAERNDVVARRVTPLEAGLGHRRFYRIELEGEAPESLVARVEPETAEPPHSDAPHAWLPEPRLEPLRGFLEAAGLPVPRSYAHVPELGVDLLEDVGAKTLASVGAGQREERYLEAAALVPRMQRLEAPPDAPRSCSSSTS